MKKKLLIFGVSGFIGRNFLKQVAHFSSLDFEITSVVTQSRNNIAQSAGHLEIVHKFDRLTLEKLLSKVKPDYVTNFIGSFGNKNYEDLFETNVEIPQKILQAILDSGLLNTRLLFIGSAAEYGSDTRSPLTELSPLLPNSIYGLTKVLQTNLIQFYYRNFRINSIIARTFNLVGDGLSKELSIGNFQEQIHLAKNGDTIKTGNLDSRRDFLDVAVAVDFYIKLLLHGEPGQVYNVCSGTSVRVGDVLTRMIAKSGKTLKVIASQDLVRENDILEIYGSRAKLDDLIARI